STPSPPAGSRRPWCHCMLPTMAGAGRGSGGFVRRVARIGWLRRILLHPVVTRPGYWFATACGFLWGALLGRFRLSRQGGVIVAQGMPKWAFGRGGTTIGAVYLTSDNVTPSILEH